MSQNQTGTRRPIPGPNDQTPRTVEEPVNRQSTRVLHVVFVLAAVTSACATGGDKAEGPLAAGSDLPAPTTIPTSSSTSLQASTPTTITTTIPTTTEVVAPVSTQPPQSAADEDLAPEVDPIGDAFQESFDREHPFLPLHRFCTPLEPPETAPADMESGITEQMLTIVQIRTLLDELTLIGMTIPADETSQALEAFADLVNRECGGIHGSPDSPGEPAPPRLSRSVGVLPDCASTVVTRPRVSQDSRGNNRLSRRVGGACRHGALPTLPAQSGTFPTVLGQSGY